MSLPDEDPYKVALYAAMDAARVVLTAEGFTPVAGCLFFELDGARDFPMRLGASFPLGQYQRASALALDGARAFSMQATLTALKSVPEG